MSEPWPKNMKAKHEAKTDIYCGTYSYTKNRNVLSCKAGYFEANSERVFLADMYKQTKLINNVASIKSIGCDSILLHNTTQKNEKRRFCSLPFFLSAMYKGTEQSKSITVVGDAPIALIIINTISKQDLTKRHKPKAKIPKINVINAK